ncbi:MAG: isoprenoid biosynthesis glyoxalase ElbB [Bdellovibrionales bacterium]|nr:isoprenoid biosynthesis glyoxalase ElbB [Bdellovibrionales bacterium]
MKNIAVVLSGCGFKDGAEITESVSTLIAISATGAQFKVFAPNKNIEATNHLTGQPDGLRNILVEAARIARSQIQPLEDLKVDHFDALVFPGGFGAAMYLCDWAEKGAQCTVDTQVESLIRKFHESSKPIGAFCIAPVLLAKVLGTFEVTLTVGDDKETISEIEKTGAHHEVCKVNDFITDRANKVVTSPAYMYDNAQPHLVFQGVQAAINELVEMA